MTGLTDDKLQVAAAGRATGGSTSTDRRRPETGEIAAFGRKTSLTPAVF